MLPVNFTPEISSLIFYCFFTSVVYFSDDLGGVNLTDCEACTPGYYCEDYGLPAPNGPCDAGYYCPTGVDTAKPAQYACSPGHFCLQGSWNETGCPSGYYQPHWAQSDCDICPAGSYCKAFGGH